MNKMFEMNVVKSAGDARGAGLGSGGAWEPGESLRGAGLGLPVFGGNLRGAGLGDLEIGGVVRDGAIGGSHSSTVVREAVLDGSIGAQDPTVVVRDAALDGSIDAQDSTVVVRDAALDGSIDAPDSTVVVRDAVLDGSIGAQDSTVVVRDAALDGSIDAPDSTVVVRDAVLEDAPRILEIYSYYIKNTVVTYEYDIPSLEEFTGRMKDTMQKYPYLVILQDGQIVGYAYARAYIGRTACDWSCETTVYLDSAATGRGLGSRIYKELEDALREMGILNMYAAVAWPQREDEYLTENSAHFHEAYGFRKIGHFRYCGYKFGRWYDLLWLEKIIGEHRADQAPVRSYPDLKR